MEDKKGSKVLYDFNETIAYMTEMVCVSDQEGKILIHNKLFARFVTGDEEIKLRGKNVFELIPCLAKQRDDYETVFSTKEPIITKSWCSLKEEELFLMIMKRAYIKGGKVLAVITSIVDETLTQKTKEENVIKTEEIKQKNIELKELNKTKDEFISFLSHDLKAPLSNVLSFGRLLLEKYNDFTDEKRKLYISQMVDGASRSFENMGQLFQYACGKEMQLNITEVNLLLEINELFELYQGKAKKKGIVCISELAELETISIYTDKMMLGYVLQNLLANAVKFTNQAGIIIVRAETVNNKIRLSVKDQGVGMSSEVVENILHTDDHISTIGTNNERGTGLGLNICKKFLAKLGSELHIESECKKGSEFYFFLPPAM